MNFNLKTCIFSSYYVLCSEQRETLRFHCPCLLRACQTASPLLFQVSINPDVFDLLKKQFQRRIVFTSSCSVYFCANIEFCVIYVKLMDFKNLCKCDVGPNHFFWPRQTITFNEIGFILIFLLSTAYFNHVSTKFLSICWRMLETCK